MCAPWVMRSLEPVVACAAGHDFDPLKRVRMRANNFSQVVRRREPPVNPLHEAAGQIRHSHSISSSIGTPAEPINGMLGFRRRASTSARWWIAHSCQPTA
jgi:hypothetical protein